MISNTSRNMAAQEQEAKDELDALENQIISDSWKLVWRELRNQTNIFEFRNWIAHLRYETEENGEVKLYVSNSRFIQSEIQNRYSHKIEQVWRKYYPNNKRVTIGLRNDVDNKQSKNIVLLSPTKKGNLTISEDLVSKDDITYNHAVFLQCFLPRRKLPVAQKHYEIRNGNVSMAIREGWMYDMNDEVKYMSIPSGAKARIILQYINDQCFKYNMREINIEQSVRGFMKKTNISSCGDNNKYLLEQLYNILCVDMMIGTFKKNERGETISSRTSFRKFSRDIESERYDGKWKPIITLDEDYVDALRNSHMVPLKLEHLIALQKYPRRMDIYSWLAYKLPNIKHNRKIVFKFEEIKELFGQEWNCMRKFKAEFRKDIAEICKNYYNDAKVDVSGDHIVLQHSKPIITQKIIISVP